MSVADPHPPAPTQATPAERCAGLVVEQVCAGYPPQRPHVLDGISAAFAPARLTVVVGPNGAGKSTLVRVLLGLITPSAGRVLLDGQDLRTLRERERAQRLAYVPQRTGSAFGFTVREVLVMAAAPLGVGRERARACAEAALQRTHALELGDAPLATLSAGQQQRAALARALAQLLMACGASAPAPTQFLLLDEPISAMDPAHAIRTLTLLRELSDNGVRDGGLGDGGRGEGGLGVVCVLHDLSLALRHAHRALVLDAAGRVVREGDAGSTLTPEVLGGVFGVRLAVADTLGVPSMVTLGPEAGAGEQPRLGRSVHADQHSRHHPDPGGGADLPRPAAGQADQGDGRVGREA